MIPFIFTIFLIAIGIFSRLMPHPANVTAIGAIALLAGYYFRDRRLAFGVPMAAMLVSDLAIGGYEFGVMVSVYASFALVALLGTWIKRHPNFATGFIGVVGASTLFFLITNFAVWAAGHGYPPTATGLLTSYIAAIPFWRNMLVGDLIWTPLLFGLAVYGNRMVRSGVIGKLSCHHPIATKSF